MKVSSLFIALFLFLFLTTCKNEKSVPSFRLDDPPEVVLKLSEILDVDKAIAIETSDSILLPAEFNIVQTKDFLIFLSSQAIQEFDLDGKFIRTIVRRGKGPEEIGFVQAYAADEDMNQLFIFHQGDREHLWMYDLKNDLKKRIPLPFADLNTPDINLNGIYFDDKETLLCVIQNSAPYSMFRMDLTGNFIDGIKGSKDGGDSGKRLVYSNQLDDEIHVMSEEPDTLFRIADSYIEPITAFSFPVGTLDKRKDSMFDFRILFGGSGSFIVQSRDRESFLRDGIPSWRYTGSKEYFLDRKDLSTKIIKEYYNDYFGFPSERFKIYPSIRGTRGAMIINAAEFKQKADQALKESNNPDARARIMSIYNGLSEEDNPVLLLGTIK